jgi:hypothetical protein
MRKYNKGLKKQGYKVVRRNFLTRKRDCASIVAALSILLLNILMRRKTITIRRIRKKASMSTRRVTSKWERHILGMSGTQLKRAQVMRMRTLQP